MGVSKRLHKSSHSVSEVECGGLVFLLLFIYLFFKKKNHHHSEKTRLFLMDEVPVSLLLVNLSLELLIFYFISNRTIDILI